MSSSEAASTQINEEGDPARTSRADGDMVTPSGDADLLAWEIRVTIPSGEAA